MTIKERFLKYICYDTQSDDTSNCHPSTSKQFNLAHQIVNELHALGVSNAFVDEYCYVYGFIPTNCDSTKTIGLIAHLDTALEASGANVNPQIISNYNGKTLIINETLNITLDPQDFPRLDNQIGHELITTDGTTLLGADDKAGIAIIMDVIENVIHTIKHPNMIITFTPDEEIGEGTTMFNFDYYQQHNCTLAYTLDGAEPNVINFENFNAATATVTINGKSIHPGSAKNKMKNSINIGVEFHKMLPIHMVPENTENYEGFYHLNNIEGNVEKTILHYIVRNHNMTLFEQQKALLHKTAEYLNYKYGENTIQLMITDSYYNMKEIIEKHPESLEYITKALKSLNIEPVFKPIRGGTDGARLSFSNIITPNLGTGGANFHGPYEYVDVDEMKLMVQVIKNLLTVIA